MHGVAAADGGATLAHARQAVTTDSPRQLSVILNHGSGTADKEPLADRIADFFAARGAAADVVVTRNGRELVAAAARAAAGDAETVVAGGGDGTIATVAHALAATDKRFGVLPLGTFNYFARRFNVPIELDGALAVIASGRTVPADAGEVNGRVFLNNASIGLYPAALIQRESTYRKLGRSRAIAYASAALMLVQPPALLNLQIEVEGARLARRTPLLFAGVNDMQLETFGIPGRECLQNGRLAVYVTRAMGRGALWRLAGRAFLRGLHGAPELERICARDLLVHLRRPRVRVAIDGEVVTLDTPLRFRMRPGALTVFAGDSPVERSGAA